MKRVVLRKPHLITGMVIIIALIAGQLNKLNISNNLIYQILSYAKYFVSAGMILYVVGRKQRYASIQEIKTATSMFCPLLLLMAVVEVIAFFTSPVPRIYGIRYYTRLLSRILDRLCIILTVIAVWSVSNEKTGKAIVKVLLLDQLVIVICGLRQVGVDGALSAILGAFSLIDGSSNVFEVHELTFTIGLAILYYLFFPKYTKKDACVLFLLLVSFVLGAKRIGTAALVIAGLFAIIIKRRGLSKRLLTFIGFVGVCVCFAYLFVIYDDRFFAILSKLGINNMGRDLVWGYFTRRTEFDISQLGWGMAGVAKMIENMSREEVLYMQAVRGLHNDILQVYINFGFIGSICWFIFNLIYIPKKLYSKFGKKSANVYIVMAVYMFITYLTDNTEGYYTCQIAFFLFPMLSGGQMNELRRRV